MTRKNIVLLSAGALLILISIWGITQAQSGLSVISLKSSEPPVTIIMPSDAPAASRPTVLIAHGFAGSSEIMRGFALTVAHAGYTTVLWDSPGHGANHDPLDLSSTSSELLEVAESALDVAASTGLVDTSRVAILGHSMGSGTAMTYGMDHPDTAATIAISPVNQAVSPALPRNLLLMAGSLEPRFLSNAEQLLADAGGKGGEFSAGTARDLVTIPNVEHVSILFSPTAHLTARDWLDNTFGLQPGAENYTDLRIFWFILGILGFICLGNAVINSIHPLMIAEPGTKQVWLKFIAILVGGISSTFLFYLLSLAGVKINQLFGILVGGYLLAWFGVAGVLGLLILRPKISRPTAREVGLGLVAFAALWLGVGLLGNFVWLPWMLIPERLWLWVPGIILLLPWFYLVANAVGQATPLRQFGWWLYLSVVILLSLFLAIRFNPELSFILLLLPLVPIMLGLHMLLISPKHGRWAFAFSGAMFTAWLILAVFPIF